MRAFLWCFFLLLLLFNKLQAQDEVLRSLYRDGEQVKAFEIRQQREADGSLILFFETVPPLDSDGYSTHVLGFKPEVNERGNEVSLGQINPDTWIVVIEPEPSLFRFGDLSEKGLSLQRSILMVEAPAVHIRLNTAQEKKD